MRFVILLIVLLTNLLFSGCSPYPSPASPTPVISTTSPIPTPTATTEQEAKKALSEYYVALQEQDYSEAASMLSLSAGMDRNAIKNLWEDMDAQGWRIVQSHISEGRVYDEIRVVFKVAITQTGLDPGTYETTNVMRFEYDEWRFSGSVLDKLALNATPKAINQLTVFPGLVLQEADKITVWINLNNESNSPIFWGDNDAVCGTLFIDDKAIDALCAHSGMELSHSQIVNEPLEFKVNAFTYSVLPTHLEVLNFRNNTNGDLWSYRFELHYQTP